jgi:hypothetical protein
MKALKASGESTPFGEALAISACRMRWQSCSAASIEALDSAIVFDRQIADHQIEPFEDGNLPRPALKN